MSLPYTSALLVSTSNHQSYQTQCDFIASTQRVLEGRQFVADGFWGAGTPGLANVIVEIWYKEYNVYPNAIKQRPAAPNLKCT